MFSCEFCEIFKNSFFTEYLWTTVSDCRLVVFEYAGKFEALTNLTIINYYQLVIF